MRRILKRSLLGLPYGPRVFVAIALIAVLFSLVGAAVSIPLLSLQTALVNLLAAVGYIGFAGLALFRRRIDGLYLPFAVWTLALLGWQHLHRAGFDGPAPVIFIIVVVALISIANVNGHRTAIVMILAAMSALYGLEQAFPEMIEGYPGEQDRRLDVFMASIVSALGTWAVVGSLRRNFEFERQKLHRANRRLLETARKLRRATRDSERAARARTSFLSTMSHEIRTPLNSIIGLAHLLQSEDSVTHANEHGAASDRVSLRTIRFSAEHLLSLINDILDYSRLDSGIIEPEIRPIRVESWLNELIETFRPVAQQQNVQMRLELPAHRPAYVQSDISRLTQIFTNLIGNAVKFSAGATVDLVLHTRRLTEVTWDVCFEVRDTGVGIPPERLATIFDEFTQAEAHTYRQFGGTGLGLAIVRRLVELFGGEIRVESEPGRGSSFFVNLALAVLTSQANAAMDPERDHGDDRIAPLSAGSADADESAAENAALNGKRALIVEDFEMNRVIAERFLKRWGLSVESAASGGEAIAILEGPARGELAFDVILMDIQMPGLDGYETTRLIRALGGPQASVPILALTAASLPEEREQAFAAGMDDYVAKPFRPEDLRQALLRNLQ